MMLVKNLTKIELEFLKSQNLNADDVYDAREQPSSIWKTKVRVAGKVLVLGAACRNGGHRLRSRSGHCVQCNPANIAYQRRHYSEGYIYIAGSLSARLLKIGTAINIEQRKRNLRNHTYGGSQDWEILFSATVRNGGKTEGEALRHLKYFKVSKAYDKDGVQQNATELVKTTFTKAINAVAKAIGNEEIAELWQSSNWQQYEFK